MNDDLIRRSDVLSKLEEARNTAKELGSWDAYHGLSTAITILLREPAVEAELVHHARWHTLRETKLIKEVECIHCNCAFRFKKKTDLNIDLMGRCPVCGAKMEVKNDRI